MTSNDSYEAANAEDALRFWPDKGHETLLELADQIEGQPGKRVVIENRKPKPVERELARTGPRAHKFQSAQSLITYAKRFVTLDQASVFADLHSNLITMAVEEERGQGGPEILTLQPTLHPSWRAWKNMTGFWVTLPKLVEFLRTQRGVVVEPDGRALLGELSQITAATEVELHRGTGRQAVNGILVKTTIQGKNGEIPVDLPEEIVIQCPLFYGQASEQVALSLDLKTSKEGDEVLARLSPTDSELAELRSFERMVNEIDVALEPTTVVMGFQQRGYWKTIT